jgi:hypothetical protein
MFHIIFQNRSCYNHPALDKILRHPDRAILFTAIVLYTPFVFMGYGADIDTYNVLEVGRHFAETFDYIPSRGPGFFVFETLTFFIDQTGGSLLTNLTLMGFALFILGGFMRLCREYSVPNYRMLTIAMMVHPFFWVNATSTMDYLMAVGFVFVGIIQIMRGHYFTAGAAFALGAGSRLTVVLLVGGFLLWQFIINKESRLKLVQSGLVFGFFTIVFYLPPADFAQWTTRFLVASVGGEEFWSPLLRIGRWGYKNLMFWSIPVTILLLWTVIHGVYESKSRIFLTHKGLPLMAGCLILLYEFFYLFIPTEPSYLIPTIPLWVIIFGVTAGSRKWAVILLSLLLVISGVITINIARPDSYNRATSAEYGLWLEPGHLVEETRVRLNYQQCGRRACNAIHKPAPDRE